jgi:hypothetical protein
MRNQVFRNAGGRFTETSAEAGPAFASPNIGRGAAFGDVDNDGDVDVLVTTNGGPAALLLNQASTGRHWLQIRLEQEPANRFAFGAWVGVERAGAPTAWRRVRSDGSYLTASDSRVHVGLAASVAVDAIVVQWPDGERERFAVAGVDRVVTLKRGSGTR